MKDKKVNKETAKKKTAKKKISDVVSYYMPISLLKEVKLLAEVVGITIKEIKIEDRDIRLYCTGSYNLLEEFNSSRVKLLGDQQPLELAPRK